MCFGCSKELSHETVLLSTNNMCFKKFSYALLSKRLCIVREIGGGRPNHRKNKHSFSYDFLVGKLLGLCSSHKCVLAKSVLQWA